MRTGDRYYSSGALPPDANQLFDDEAHYLAALGPIGAFETAVANDPQAERYEFNPHDAVWSFVIDRLGALAHIPSPRGEISLVEHGGTGTLMLAPGRIEEIDIQLTPPYDVTKGTMIDDRVSHWANSMVRMSVDNRTTTYGILQTPYPQPDRNLPHTPFSDRLIAASVITHLLAPTPSPRSPLTAYQSAWRGQRADMLALALNPSELEDGNWFVALNPELSDRFITQETDRYLASLSLRAEGIS